MEYIFSFSEIKNVKSFNTTQKQLFSESPILHKSQFYQTMKRTNQF